MITAVTHSSSHAIATSRPQLHASHVIIIHASLATTVTCKPIRASLCSTPIVLVFQPRLGRRRQSSEEREYSRFGRSDDASGAEGYTYLGCYLDSLFHRVLEFGFTDQRTTPQVTQGSNQQRPLRVGAFIFEPVA